MLVFFLPKIGCCVYTVYIRYTQYIHTGGKHEYYYFEFFPRPYLCANKKTIKPAYFKWWFKGWRPLPSIRNLAKELQISVITTKRAYEELEKEGYIETVAGKGTYVSRKNNELLKNSGFAYWKVKRKRL